MKRPFHFRACDQLTIHFSYRGSFYSFVFTFHLFSQLTCFYFLQPIWKPSTGTLVSQYMNLCSSTTINIPSKGTYCSSTKAQSSHMHIKIFSKGPIYIHPIQKLRSGIGTTFQYRNLVSVQERQLGTRRKILRKAGILISQIILLSYNHTEENIKQLFY